MRKNDAKMIDPKFIQNHPQEVPRPSGHQKTFKSNVKHPRTTPGRFGKIRKFRLKPIILMTFST